MSFDNDTVEVETEEPLPGWLRYEREGEKPWYKTPIPRKIIRSAKMLREFVDKEKKAGRMAEIDLSGFTFKRRLGLRKKSCKPVPQDDSVQVEQGTLSSYSTIVKPQQSIVERLTRNVSTEHLDHRKLLSNSSKLLDQFRDDDGYQTPLTFESLKTQVSSSSDLREMLSSLNRDTHVNEAINLMFSDACLGEISKLDTCSGPLVYFPTSVNENQDCRAWN